MEDEKVNQLFLTKASNSTKRLIERVDELTDINVLQGKNPPLDYEKFDIVKLTDEVFELVENKALKQKISLKFKQQNPIDATKRVVGNGNISAFFWQAF